MRLAPLVVIAVTAASCGTVGFSPPEVCARDGMISSGRNHEAVPTSSGTQKPTDIVCRPPRTPAERCEVEAARASGRAKNAGCRRLSANAVCDEASSPRSYTEEQAAQIEAEAKAVHDRTLSERMTE